MNASFRLCGYCLELTAPDGSVIIVRRETDTTEPFCFDRVMPAQELCAGFPLRNRDLLLVLSKPPSFLLPPAMA
jgi:hypothetical protein